MIKSNNIKLNTNSDCYYIDKAVIFKPLKLIKVHLIDDDCNQFTCTITGTFTHVHTYISPKDINIIDCETYSEEAWNEMTQYIEYEHAIVL